MGSYSRSRSRSCSYGSSSRSRSRGSSYCSFSNKRQRSRSRGRSRSGTPDIPIRRDSPSFLEKRRITSARKRPIPYRRKRFRYDSPSSESSYSSYSRSSRSYSRSSRSRSRSSSSTQSQGTMVKKQESITSSYTMKNDSSQFLVIMSFKSAKKKLSLFFQFTLIKKNQSQK